MLAVKTLKGVTLALVGVGQSLRVARREVQRAKGRKEGRREMKKCIFLLLSILGLWSSGLKGGCQWKGIGKNKKEIKLGVIFLLRVKDGNLWRLMGCFSFGSWGNWIGIFFSFFFFSSFSVRNRMLLVLNRARISVVEIFATTLGYPAGFGLLPPRWNSDTTMLKVATYYHTLIRGILPRWHIFFYILISRGKDYLLCTNSGTYYFNPTCICWSQIIPILLSPTSVLLP